ncbi:MAG: anti-sigma factor domain-containing protein [Vulcanibacillus sp.]
MDKGIILEMKNEKAILITKEGEFISVPLDLSWNIGDEVIFNQNISTDTNKSPYPKKSFMKKGLWVALAASIMLLIMPFTNITQASTYITIDINPSIELELKGDKVINIKALNIDGEEIVSRIPSDSRDLYSITENIISQSKKLGYLIPNEENYIMIGLCEENKDFLIIEYEQFLEEKLIAEQLDVKILVVNGTKNDKDMADSKQVSLGKYVIQQDKKLQGIDISDQQLNEDNVKELFNNNAELIQNNNDIESNHSESNNSKSNQNPNSSQNNNATDSDLKTNKENEENNSSLNPNNNKQDNDNLNNENTNKSNDNTLPNGNNEETTEPPDNNDRNKNISGTIENVNKNESKPNQNTR